MSNKNIHIVDRIELSVKSPFAYIGGFLGFLTGFQVLLGGMTTMESLGWIMKGIGLGALLHFIFFHLPFITSSSKKSKPVRVVKRLFMPIAIVLIGGFAAVAVLVGYQMYFK